MHLTSHSTLGREELETGRLDRRHADRRLAKRDGPPLVLVHGATADHTRWAPVMAALEERFTVLAVDRRGRGRSGDATCYAIEREYEDVATVVEWAGGSVSVLGHSYGGICALEAALLTEGIGRLVLYEAPVGFLQTPPHVVHRLQALLDADERDELLVPSCGKSPACPPSRSTSCGRCRPGRPASPRRTRFPERSVRIGNTSSTPIASGHCTYRRCCSRRRQPRRVRGGRRGTVLGPARRRVAVMPGQRHAAMDTGTELFVAEVLASSRPSDSVTAARPLPSIDCPDLPTQGWRR